MPTNPIIAIDGPAASGKTTVGKLLAQRLVYGFLDTGLMYRAITWIALESRVSIEDEGALIHLAQSTHIEMDDKYDATSSRVWVNNQPLEKELRGARVDESVSLISKVPAIRRLMVEQQRRIAQPGRIVVVGRDIGTVVLPNAKLKVFLSASPEERSRRRFKELKMKGEIRDFKKVLEETVERDWIDTNRSESPLKIATDAIEVNTDGLTVENVVVKIQGLLGDIP